MPPIDSYFSTEKKKKLVTDTSLSALLAKRVLSGEGHGSDGPRFVKETQRPKKKKIEKGQKSN